MKITTSFRLRCMLYFSYVFVAGVFLPVNATPPPEETPAICAESFCVLITPQEPLQLVRYVVVLDVKSKRQTIYAYFSSDLIVSFVALPHDGQSKMVEPDPGFAWNYQSAKLATAHACMSCGERSQWRAQRVGIAAATTSPNALNQFISSAGIRVWPLNLRGKWNGSWRDLPLGTKERVRRPSATEGRKTQ